MARAQGRGGGPRNARGARPKLPNDTRERGLLRFAYAACCGLRVAHCVLRIALCLLPVAVSVCCLLRVLRVADCVLSIACCVLRVAYCVLPVARGGFRVLSLNFVLRVGCERVR